MDSNQKYKTATPPSAARCVTIHPTPLVTKMISYRNITVMAPTSNPNTATPLPGQFLSNFNLSAIQLGMFSGLNGSSRSAGSVTSTSKGHSSSDAIVID